MIQVVECFLEIVYTQRERADDHIEAQAPVNFLIVSPDKSTSIIRSIPSDCHVDLRAGNMRCGR